MEKVSSSVQMDLLNPDWIASEEARKAFRQARQESPIFWQDAPGGGFWVVTRHRDIVDISGRPDVYSSSRGISFVDHPGATKGVILFTDPPEHRRLKNYVAEFFTPRSTSRLTPWITEQCRLLIERGRGRAELDFIADMAADLPLNTISEMLGVPESERGRFLILANRIFDVGPSGGDEYVQSLTDLGEFGLQLARGNHEGDLFAAMRAVENNGAPLVDEEFSGMFMQIAGAAVETTRTVLGSIILGLAERPDILSSVRNDPSLARSAVDEFLRWSPPFYCMRRTAIKDDDLGGAQVKTGDKVVMYYLSGNFDEDAFEDVEAFDISRRPNPHLTFGVGEHVCVGLLLARAELRIFLEEFAKQVETVEISGPVERRRSIESQNFKKIPVRLNYRVQDSEAVHSINVEHAG